MFNVFAATQRDALRYNHCLDCRAAVAANAAAAAPLGRRWSSQAERVVSSSIYRKPLKSPITRYMLWLYERGLEDLRIETSFDNDTQEYVLIIKGTLEPSRTERFPDAETFGLRVNALVNELANERWTPSGAPILLQHAWRIG